MERIIVTQDNFKNIVKEIYEEERINIINETWNRLSDTDKKFAVEFLKVLYPEKSKQINEATGWNTFWDFVGILDPSGVVDFLNGISYWNQGDKLFAILSWVSVLPYFGDLLAKPVIAVLKVGGDSVKAFKAATVAGDAVKMAETASKTGGVTAKFVEKSASWGAKLIEVLEKASIKYPVIKRLINLVKEYVGIFVTAGKEMKAGAKLGKGISATEKETLKQTFRGFRDYGGYRNKHFRYILNSDIPVWHRFVGGAPRIFGNPATRSLMRRTKWYLGLLDFLGIVDAKTTPDELMKDYPNLSDKISQYNETPNGQKNWAEDFGSEENKQEKSGSEIENITGTNPLEVFLGPLFA